MLAVGALALAPVLGAADHFDAEQFEAPFLIDWAGVAMLVATSGIALVVAWRVHDLTGT